jgi:hypothetical protein
MLASQLLQQLAAQTRQCIQKAEALKQLDAAALYWRSQPESWNILECLEHLNRYGQFYLPEIKKAIEKSNSGPEANFKSGWLGNYFAESMKPKEKLNRMNTFKDKNPLNEPLKSDVIDEFLRQQAELLGLLKQAEKVSLNKINVGTTLSRFITVKLGDTFRFIINHNLRHLQQIERIEQAVINA